MSIYAELRELQDGRCGMCGEASSRLVEDHDHNTGLIRGLLCRSCNIQEGQHRRCSGAQHECCVCIWRQTPAVAWLGRTERYEGWFDWSQELDFRERPFMTAIQRATERRAELHHLQAIVDNLYTEGEAP